MQPTPHRLRKELCSVRAPPGKAPALSEAMLLPSSDSAPT